MVAQHQRGRAWCGWAAQRPLSPEVLVGTTGPTSTTILVTRATESASTYMHAGTTVHLTTNADQYR
eukprot:6638769-Pyramimonas_sp.AAC.1